MPMNPGHCRTVKLCVAIIASSGFCASTVAWTNSHVGSCASVVADPLKPNHERKKKVQPTPSDHLHAFGNSSFHLFERKGGLCKLEAGSGPKGLAMAACVGLADELTNERLH